MRTRRVADYEHLAADRQLATRICHSAYNPHLPFGFDPKRSKVWQLGSHLYGSGPTGWLNNISGQTDRIRAIIAGG